MKKVYGNTAGLKASQIRRLEKLYIRRVPTEYLISYELVRELTRITAELRRQIGLLIDRAGRIAAVIAGNHQQIMIPAIRQARTGQNRLRGLRCVHTHLKTEPLSRDDFTDLALLRLDLMAAVTLKQDGLPDRIFAAHLMPANPADTLYQMIGPLSPQDLDIGCLSLIQSLEAELARQGRRRLSGQARERALLVDASTGKSKSPKEALAELNALALSGDVVVAGTLTQHRSQPNAKFVLGRGKLEELTIMALQKDATLIIFNQELSPAQIRSITNQLELKVIDRTQLILDIFAQRAQSREGKLQVELAQLKYRLPRLVSKNTAMSRLSGGIGGRGPGETKLEINRRRTRQRIRQLENQVTQVIAQRAQQKALRQKRRLPVISIIGYTNAGKSTLLNTLTHSKVHAADQLFATLDPSSRRLRFPQDFEVIITDTVGFIRNLPNELLAAFRATLEELEYADLLLHIIDISNPDCSDHIRAVESILSDLNLQRLPCLRVLNKQDLLPAEAVRRYQRQMGGVAVAATDRSSLRPLIAAIAQHIRPLTGNAELAYREKCE
jgi:GTP-binding protein HflX